MKMNITQRDIFMLEDGITTYITMCDGLEDEYKSELESGIKLFFRRWIISMLMKEGDKND